MQTWKTKYIQSISKYSAQFLPPLYNFLKANFVNLRVKRRYCAEVFSCNLTSWRAGSDWEKANAKVQPGPGVLLQGSPEKVKE